MDAGRKGHRIKKKLAVDAVEAEIVRLIFRLFLEGEGDRGPFGLKAIAVWLNENGYRTRRCGSWGVGQLHSMLTNPVYAEVPAIIDAATFERIQRVLKERNPRVTAPRFVSGPILLSGLAVCAACKGAMSLRTGTSRWGNVYRYYACSSCTRKGKMVCKGRSIRMDRLDGLVTQHLSE